MNGDTYRVVVTREDGHLLAAAASTRTGRAAAELVARGLSVGDVAALLGISPQLVSRLAARAS